MALTAAERIRKFELAQVIVGGLGLLLSVIVSVVANSVLMQSVAEQNVRFVSRMVQANEMREARSNLEEMSTHTFSRIQYRSPLPDRSFTLPAVAEFLRPSLWEQLTSEESELPVQNRLSSAGPEFIQFRSNRLRLVPYGLGIWLILVVISIPQTRFMKRRLLEHFERERQVAKGVERAEVAAQVRHNLRTPLAALMRLPRETSDLGYLDREILSGSIEQIKAITAALDERPLGRDEVGLSTNLFSTLNRSVRELRLVVPCQIGFETEVSDALASAEVAHVPHELQALLGNIVNNAVDAISVRSGEIELSAKDLGAEARIEITDTGAGIAFENRDRVFDRAYTTKPGGSGLGLSHAKLWIERWGGRIWFEGHAAVGTTLMISLPITARKSWHFSRLKMKASDAIWILDDQTVIHQLWDIRLQEAGIAHLARFFRTAEEVRTAAAALDENQLRKVHAFFDFDLGGAANGADLLNALPPLQTRCLVTGHFDDGEIQENCRANGIFLIPKSQIYDVPITVIDSD